MTLLKYRMTRAEKWDASFAIRLGKVATKLYLEAYKTSPPRMSNGAGGIAYYPCGVIERAYGQLRAQDVPLVRPSGPVGRARLKTRVAQKHAKGRG